MIQEWLDVITDPAHVMAEVTFALVEASIGAVVGGFLVRRHDRKKHANHTENGAST